MTTKLANRWPDLLLPFGIIACLMVIFVPLPTGVMDILLAANISVAVVILLSTVYVRSPLELSVFPSLLLMTTLARLALNIGTTRLILNHGAAEGELAAGSVIQGFAHFVTGDSLAVGLVIFAIIIVIQFVVITKGATRISEVAARFTLDGLPGRQMAIDADLNAGVIDNEEAQRRREETIAHADFYGTMDGASKFVRGDAIAGIIITLINITGGLFIGLSNSMGIEEASTTFTKLTIGDGLVSQLPALLISMAAGLLVTRSTRQTDLPRESITQVFSKPIVLLITALFLCLMVLTELPKIPLLVLAAACLIGAYLLSQNENNQPEEAAPPEPAPQKNELGIEHLLSDEFVEIQLGIGLLPLANSQQNGKLLSRVTDVRCSIANHMGVVLPKVTVRDNMSLEKNQFKILIHGRIVEQGRLEPEFCLAVDARDAIRPLPDGAVRGLAEDHLAEGPAYWISPESINEAIEYGYQVRTATDVLVSLLEQTAIEHADHLLSRDATKQLLESVKQHAPTLVEELYPKHFSISQIQQVLKALVREGVSIRPLTLILETIGDFGRNNEPIWFTVEQVRLRLAHHIGAGLAGDSTEPIATITLSSELENRILNAWNRKQKDLSLNLTRSVLQSLANSVEEAAQQMVVAGIPPIIKVEQEIRPIIAELITLNTTPVFVLGSTEARSIRTRSLGEIKSENLRQTPHAA